jgi:hypothetical protein
MDNRRATPYIKGHTPPLGGTHGSPALRVFFLQTACPPWRGDGLPLPPGLRYVLRERLFDLIPSVAIFVSVL